ncbi:MAG: glycosyltransferase family 1 protein [Ruminococcaceae bacterium]|nr:glycosyltransferase family 1 protein [Oscillospiraceae bacterium]
MNKIRVLQIQPGLGVGGITSVVLNHYHNIDKSMIKFDFAIFTPPTPERLNEAEQSGSRVYVLPRKSESYKAYKDELTKIINNGNYDIVHAHQNYQSFIPLYYAKKCGIRTRIAHAHATKIDKPTFFKKCLMLFSRLINPLIVTDYFSCGIKAGYKMFGRKKFNLLKNGIKIDNFRFSVEKRDAVREKMNWKNKLVIGNIGRLSEQKNQVFLVEIFAEIVKLKDNAILCICGEGEKKDEILDKAKALGIDDKVFLLGNRNDVNELLSGFDVFVLPSLFEGLPVTGIEVLSNGLPAVMSDEVTDEFDEYNKISFLSLKASKEIWAREILKKATEGHDITMAEKMRQSGYNISDSAKMLENFYKNASRR